MRRGWDASSASWLHLGHLGRLSRVIPLSPALHFILKLSIILGKIPIVATRTEGRINHIQLNFAQKHLRLSKIAHYCFPKIFSHYIVSWFEVALRIYRIRTNWAKMNLFFLFIDDTLISQQDSATIK